MPLDYPIYSKCSSQTSDRLDNVTTMLLMAPMTMSVFKVLERNPVPLLLAQVWDLGGKHEPHLKS